MPRGEAARRTPLTIVRPADDAGLRYSSDLAPGIVRRRAGRGFTYRRHDGAAISDAERARIKALAVPPAWTDVWICADPHGHLQATGRDARGRKQYRYHPAWREQREREKFDHLVEFGRALPRIRTRVRRDLVGDGVTAAKVLAAVTALLEVTLVRVGNDEYATANDSYGLTTLRDKHAKIRVDRLQFVFQGKGGREHRIDVTDARLARVVRSCRALPGQRLFQYVDDDGKLHPVCSDDVNAYLREIAGDDITAKDYRTWMGTLFATAALASLPPPTSETVGKRIVKQTISVVAEKLNNTPAVCRASYVHPQVIDSYLDATLPALWERCAASSPSGLIAEERRLLGVLRAFRRRSGAAAAA